ncbi:phospholipase A and acyltransferase 3-like [Erythrolamprus reginae]|uniref:phospholipase A and acyltransferase 3-like n=1 Tax=Erythrolamprus reginae TaxID=121349 RepID=UPI00396C6306
MLAGSRRTPKLRTLPEGVNNSPPREELKPGDVIEIFRSSCPHWALYVGDQQVVHLITECEHFADGSPSPLAILSERVCVKKDWLEDVVRKDRYRVNNKHDETHPPLPLSKILWQTEELVGKEMPYTLSSQNCENFVMELRYGPEISEQGKAFKSAEHLLE